MAIQVKQFRTGGDRNFGYLAVESTTGDAFIVDASFSPGMIVDHAAEKGYTLRYVFSTHGHDDHCNGNGVIRARTGLVPLLFGDRCPLTGILVEDQAVFPLGTFGFMILHTPGHTPDSICILAVDHLFTGDTLFVGKVGGTWSDEDSIREYRSLHESVIPLPDDTVVWPGHDYGIDPSSTVGREKATNPFLLQPDVVEFIDLKKNWGAYKKEHGIV
jgi:hydroxyacylglutathione hydrolase